MGAQEEVAGGAGGNLTSTAERRDDVTEGVGLCQRRGGAIEVSRPGDRVFFEPGYATNGTGRTSS